MNFGRPGGWLGASLTSALGGVVMALQRDPKSFCDIDGTIENVGMGFVVLGALLLMVGLAVWTPRRKGVSEGAHATTNTTTDGSTQIGSHGAGDSTTHITYNTTNNYYGSAGGGEGS